jgi:surface protein
MFNRCSGLTSLELGNFNVNSVIDMGSIFRQCSNLSTLHTPYNVRLSVELPAISGAAWHLPDGTEVTELPQNLSTSVLLTRTPVITTTTEALNMPDVIRVKYVPYSYTVRTDNTDPDNQVTFSVVEGRLAEGLQMYPATGEIYGIPIESGEFKIKVEAAYSNPKYPPSYAELTLTVLENTDENVGTASDSGYRITQSVPDLDTGSLSGPGTQLLVSEGEYAEFQDAVYLDGRRLQSGTEYTSEAGSTRITIQNQTLANAGAGSHTLSLEFRTQDTGALRRAAQNLTISAGEDTGSGDNTGNNNGTNNGSGSSGSSGGSDEGREENGAGSRTESAVIDYIVQPGDNLWKISAKFFGDGSHWRQIYMDNANIIRNPNILRTGWRLKIYLTAGNSLTGSASTPVAKSLFTGNSYVVQQGDNLWKIAGEVYGKTGRWREIYEANRSVLPNPERIYAKQVLIIPR